MLLVEWTMNGTLYRISNEYLALDNAWKGVIKDFTAHYKINKRHGGYCRGNVSNIDIIPSFFSTNSEWPPPLSASITVKQTTNDEDVAETLITGKAHWFGQKRGNIRYAIYGDAFSATVAKNKAWTTQTLTQIMSTLCESSALNLTFHSSMARSPSPDVHYTMKTDRLTVDFADDLCAYFGHMFYIESTDLYLVDMFQNNSSRDIGYAYFPSEYLADRPAASVTATTQGTITKVSDYPYGDELTFEAYHNSSDNNSSALTDILTLQNKRRANLVLPSTTTKILPGERLKWTNTRFPNNVVMTINARDIHYDWGNKRVTIGGEGVMTT